MQIKDLIPWARKGDAPAGKTGDNPVATLQRDMNDAVERFWNRFGQGLNGFDWPWGGNEARSDVVETKNAIEVSIELPGMDMQDIEVNVSDDMLTIKGEKKVESQEEKKGYHLSERRYGSFQRVIGLPDGVDRDAATATFKNGVLSVTLPKRPEAKAQVRKIDIAAG